MRDNKQDKAYDENNSVTYDVMPTLVFQRQRYTPRALPVSETEPPSVEPEATAESWPEPGPNWPDAYQKWGVAWDLHIYVFATIFLGFAVYAGYFIAQGLYVGLNHKYLGFSLNVVMLILGFTRSFVLFLDPYHQGSLITSTQAMRVMWSLASPCLTSADCLVILALVETAHISLAPQRLQKFSVIIKIIILHFVLVLTTDFAVSEVVEAKPMLVFCQIFFIVWGSLLGVGYVVLAYKLDRKLFGHKNDKDKKDILYIRLIYASAVNNFVLSGMFIYSSAGVFGVYSDVEFVEAWSWWAMQTCFRVSEVSSAILVFTVSAKRKKLKRTERQAISEPTSVDMTESGHKFTEIPCTEFDPQSKIKRAPRQKQRKTSMFSDLFEAKMKAYQANSQSLQDDT